MIAPGPAITTEALGHSYGSRVALDGIDLVVPARSLFALLGPNGGGKSTLFQILSTLLIPTRGRAFVAGEDVVRNPSRVRGAIGVVFQSPSLDRKLTVHENLRASGAFHGLTGQSLLRREDLLLELFELRDRRGELVEQLSGGLVRRVDLARALLPAPRVLLLDEPTTGLDPVSRREVLDALTRARDGAGTTSFLATHLIDEAERCDGVALLDQGRLLKSGAPDELVREIGGEIITLTPASEHADEIASSIGGTFGLEARVEGGTVRMEREDAASFLPRLLDAMSGRVRSVTVAAPTLEDVFFRETGHRLERRDDA